MANNNNESDTQNRNRTSTVRYSVSSLFRIIKEQDDEKGDVLAANQKSLYDLKREISVCSKKNFNIEKDIQTLDMKIALLIKNRITLEEVIASSGDINSLLLQRTTTLKDKREREHYGQLFYLLQRETVYISTLARLVKLGEIDNLLQTVMFTLYGNQYDDEEEHLLLSTFQRVLKDEFDEAGSIGTLLRANTALTRMMTTYTRRGPGQAYLKTTLTHVLTSLVEDKDLLLEINPLKVYETYINDYESKTGQQCNLPRKVTAEEAAANQIVQDLIKPRLKKLDDLANRFVDNIIKSLDTVPYGIRWICKQIRDLAKEKFPTATREQVCSLIGGFFLLRFVNPAVVTPQAFMLVDVKMSANTRRNLTLLAKILQNLANNAQFGGLKEYYMAPLNEFLNNVRNKLNTFLEELTRVEDLDEHLQLDKYLRLGKTSDVYINITLNEMYFIHSLLIEHLKVLESKSTDRTLREILNELGPAPPQLPKKDNSNVELLLINRYSGGEPSDSKEIKPEQIYAETKYLLFTIIKSLPNIIADKNDPDIRSVIESAEKYAHEKKDFKLAEKVKKIQTNCKKLVAEGIISESDNYAKLRRDTVQELINYEAQIKKTQQDIELLKTVLHNINEHNQFLTQQYQAYKEYLANVRQNCTTTTTKDSKQSKQTKKKGPFKFSHSKLQQDGIIIESEVPEERRGNIFFQFAETAPGLYTVTVMYKSRTISEMKLQLDDLLERQHNNNLELETDFLKLNVNLVIFLLNKHFMS
mmetsp:Transcript_21623/g.30230  ORF Transcript_21623/g.30230 Transcript_21623/m.30230 type:complete len:756 (-) Transcript_21623:71-2338(-)|eukprot:CAMPEP_0168562954 /NCGR_PEP_ID=MMETSP0413-20121227/12408_1 /TAXON_ID=136452 /ORGANISM="Filamoeba nolandi, Strain NC-AS-23-1" /LENGTH=755 /DNA_ID=CAMNT_0008594435 /DNA_START=177 /DNA_END=2444 /DNA_ORIENTATION=-